MKDEGKTLFSSFILHPSSFVSEANTMRTFQVSLPHFYQIDSHDQSAVMAQMVSLFAGPMQHCRFITFVMPASLERLER